VTEKHNDHASGEATADITSALRANFFEPDAPTTARAHGAVSGIDELPSGSALLVVKRGPNAGSRFVLDQPITSAGRHPNSDICCDDITVSRRHAEFRRQNGEFQVVLANGDEIQIGKFRLVFLTAPRPNEDRL